MSLNGHKSTARGVSVSPRRFLRPKVIVPSVIVFILVGAALLVWLPQILVGNWLEGQEVDAATARQAVGNAAQVVLFALGGLIALVGVGLSLSRHGLELEKADLDQAKESRRIQELVEQRHAEAERELRARFTQSVALLSDPDKATTRQAGVYALGALADDWSAHGRYDERQVCLDVLCGYLRSAWNPAGAGADDERRIRTAAFSLVGAHLRPQRGEQTWVGALFNLRGCLVDFDVDFREIELSSGIIDLTDATIAGGELSFREARFSGGEVRFNDSEIGDGKISFTQAVFEAGVVSFEGATVRKGAVLFTRADFAGGTVDFSWSRLTGGNLTLSGSSFSGGSLAFVGAVFSGLTLRFARQSSTIRLTMSSGTIDFEAARFESGRILISRLEMSSGDIIFDDSENSGCDVEIRGLRMSGGSIRFADSDIARGGSLKLKDAVVEGGSINFSNLYLSGLISLERVQAVEGVVQTEELDVVGGTIVLDGRRNPELPLAIPAVHPPQ